MTEDQICAEARALFAQRDRLEAEIRKTDTRLRELRSEYRTATRTLVNDMVRFRNAAHNTKVAA